jgi:hypothetical protein
MAEETDNTPKPKAELIKRSQSDHENPEAAKTRPVSMENAAR